MIIDYYRSFITVIRLAIFAAILLTYSGCGSLHDKTVNQDFDYRETAQIFLKNRYKGGGDSIWPSMHSNPILLEPNLKLAEPGISEMRIISLPTQYIYDTSHKKYEALLATTDWNKIDEDVGLDDGATIYILNPDGSLKMSKERNIEYKVFQLNNSAYRTEDWRDGELFMTRLYKYDKDNRLTSYTAKNESDILSDSVEYEYDTFGHLKKITNTGEFLEDYNYTLKIKYDDEKMEVTGTHSNNNTFSDFRLKILSDKNFFYEDKDGFFDVTLNDEGSLLAIRQRGTNEFMRWDNREISRLPIEEETLRIKTRQGFEISTKTHYKKNNTEYSNKSYLRVHEFRLDDHGKIIASIIKSDYDKSQFGVTSAEYAYFKRN